MYHSYFSKTFDKLDLLLEQKYICLNQENWLKKIAY